MNNIVIAVLPVLLFGGICAMLTRPRFAAFAARIAWICVILIVAAVHLGVGLSVQDNALIIALMPVTAYLPLIIAMFILSRGAAGNFFAVSLALLAAVTAGLVRKLCAYAFWELNLSAVWQGVACAAVVAVVCAVAAAVVFVFLRKIFLTADILRNKNRYLLFVILLPVMLSLYQISSVVDVTAIILLLAADVCVFAVTVAFIVVMHNNYGLQTERENIRRQIALEREEYKITEQKLELGRRYRHDMRHHFAAIRGLLQQGDARGVEEYLDSLDDGIASFEQRDYCKNAVINAVLSALLERARGADISVRAEADIAENIPFESSDIGIVLANAVENAVNACGGVQGERNIYISACCDSVKFTLSVENSVASAIPLDEDGLPVAKKSEEHGYGLASIKYIVEKYNGMISCGCSDSTFRLKLVLFAAAPEGGAPRRKRAARRAFAAVPATLIAGIIALNCLPSTAGALEGIPVVGTVVSALDFRSWGFGWGDSQIDVNYPQTGDEDVDKSIEEYISDCIQEFMNYFGLRDQGYVGSDINSTVMSENARTLVIRISGTLNAASSKNYSRYFVIDKQAGEILQLGDLFAEGSDYISVLDAQIKEQIEYRVNNYYDSFYGYPPFESDEPFTTLANAEDGWSFYVDERGVLIIEFEEDTIAVGGVDVTFEISLAAIQPIIAPDGILGGTQ